ncbi:hypothetical protein, partial [Raoultella ornithinolytica]
IKSIKFLVGGAFILVLLIALFGSITAERPAETAEHVMHKHPEALKLASDGPLGKFDRRQLQRGFLVYKEV